MNAGLRHRLVPAYFQLGGVAGGSVTLAALAVARGGSGAALARPALLAAPVLLAVCAGFLTAHLTKPDRFWRVLTRFKWRSPISLGAWALTGLGLVSPPLAVVAWGGPAGLAAGGGRALLTLAGGLGWFVAAYTGVLLTASSRPAWTRSRLLGAAFCVSGFAGGAAWMRLLAAGADVGPPALALAEALASRLLLLAGLLWVAIDRTLQAEETFRPWRGRYWVGVLVGFALPVILLDRGGGAALAGAALAVWGGVLVRAAVYSAGEPPPRRI